MTTRKRTILALSVSAVIIFLDQLTKMLVLRFMTEYQYVPIIGDYFGLRLVFNDRAAFSLGGGNTWIFTLMSTLAMLALIYFVPRFHSKSWLIMGGIALGGVVGNLIDRLTKEPGFPNGHVVDFVQIPFNFPIFNIADMAISTMAVLFAVRLIRGDVIGGKK